MAVIPAIPGLTVTVQVAGQTATEYAVPEDDTSRHIAQEGNTGDNTEGSPSTACYIESRSGLRFGVNITYSPVSDKSEFDGYEDLLIWVFIDGKYARSKCISLAALSMFTTPLSISSALVNTSRHDRAQKREFVFAPVTAVEDAAKERVTRDSEIASSMGLIRVDISLGAGRTKYIPATCSVPVTPIQDTITLAEKSMKGRELTHGMQFRAGPIVKKPSNARHEKQRKLGTFKFLYRSEAALRKEMILPPLPSPSSSPQVNDDSDKEVVGLSVEELRQRYRELRRSQNDRIKRERNIKRERSADAEVRTGLKAKRARRGEVIDLTED